MHIPSLILREPTHFQSRVYEQLPAAHTAFFSEVTVARHACIHVVRVVVARCFVYMPRAEKRRCCPLVTKRVH